MDCVDLEGYFIAINVLALIGGLMLTETVVYAAQDIRGAYLTTPALIGLQFVFSGLFIKLNSLPGWLSPWVESCSIIRWMLEGNFINQFENNKTLFVDIGFYSTYDAFLTLFGWGSQSKWLCFNNMFYFIFVFKMTALIANGVATMFQRGGRNFKKFVEEYY